MPPELQQASCEVLVAHPEQNEREFITAALRGWGYRAASRSDAQEALGASPPAGLQLAIVDRAMLAIDLDVADAARGRRRGACCR